MAVLLFLRKCVFMDTSPQLTLFQGLFGRLEDSASWLEKKVDYVATKADETWQAHSSSPLLVRC